MAEYTYEDIIMNPEDPRLEGAIGKECYFSDYPKMLLDDARSSLPEDTFRLKNIRKDLTCPFIDKKGVHWPVIIIKKEEPKPKYVPFKSMKEFLERYTEVKEESEFGSFEDSLYRCGMWLKDKNTETDVYCMVNEIWDSGLVIGDKKMSIIGTRVLNDTMDWRELFEDYTFLDGTPCGKEA